VEGLMRELRSANRSQEGRASPCKRQLDVLDLAIHWVGSLREIVPLAIVAPPSWAKLR
jgi:hypothetical protein